VNVPDGFQYHRLVPREWQRELEQLTPRSDRTTWLQLAWFPGDPWGPVQRWAIYEMVPLPVWDEIIRGHRAKGYKPEEIWEYVILDCLRGPHPRELGYYDMVLRRFISDSLVTRDEWELFREHNAIPKLYWVIQGENGGHKRTFSKLEQKYLKLAGLPADPPTPGSLPYAPFDRRVMDQLAWRDRLKALKGKLSDDLDARSTEQQAFRTHLVKWLENQMQETLESDLIKLGDQPRGEDMSEQIDTEINNYIETGSTNGVVNGD
jgi:hypothetical protein